VVALESQAAHVQRQQYRIYDAATGLIEEGWVNVADMISRVPWLDEKWDFPVDVTWRAETAAAPQPTPA
jgi:predicted RecB family nuclease